MVLLSSSAKLLLSFGLLNSFDAFHLGKSPISRGPFPLTPDQAYSGRQPQHQQQQSSTSELRSAAAMPWAPPSSSVKKAWSPKSQTTATTPNNNGQPGSGSAWAPPKQRNKATPSPAPKSGDAPARWGPNMSVTESSSVKTASTQSNGQPWKPPPPPTVTNSAFTASPNRQGPTPSPAPWGAQMSSAKTSWSPGNEKTGSSAWKPAKKKEQPPATPDKHAPWGPTASSSQSKSASWSPSGDGSTSSSASSSSSSKPSSTEKKSWSPRTATAMTPINSNPSATAINNKNGQTTVGESSGSTWSPSGKTTLSASKQERANKIMQELAFERGSKMPGGGLGQGRVVGPAGPKNTFGGNNQNSGGMSDPKAVARRLSQGESAATLISEIKTEQKKKENGNQRAEQEKFKKLEEEARRLLAKKDEFSNQQAKQALKPRKPEQTSFKTGRKAQERKASIPTAAKVIPTTAKASTPKAKTTFDSGPRATTTPITNSYKSTNSNNNNFPSQPSPTGGLMRSSADKIKSNSITTQRPQQQEQYLNNDQTTQDMPTRIEGKSLKTWTTTSEEIKRVMVTLTTEGRPLTAHVELWNGPDNTPEHITVYSENGPARPLRVVIATPEENNALCVRNVAPLNYPLGATVDAEVVDEQGQGSAGLLESMEWLSESSVGYLMQGGAVYTKNLAPSVLSAQILLETHGRPLNARIEVLQGPNNYKQVMEVYIEDGRTRPFFVLIQTPGRSNTIRIVNTAPLEFPILAHVEPCMMDELSSMPAFEVFDETGQPIRSSAEQAEETPLLVMTPN